MYCGFLLVCNEPILMDTVNRQLTNLSFTLHWHPLPNKTFLDSFILFYTKTNLIYLHTQVKRQQLNQATSIGPISSNLLEYTVSNLLPFSTYCFWLQAVYSKDNVTFDHKESEMLCDIVTPPTGNLLHDCLLFHALFAEPSAPLNLTAEEIAPTWISISWKPPVHKNGLIQYYTVKTLLYS